jgi:hypothetical protein
MTNVVQQLKQDLVDGRMLAEADNKRERRARRNLKLKANGGLYFPKPSGRIS